jgi:hypothetical protein
MPSSFSEVPLHCAVAYVSGDTTVLMLALLAKLVRA